MKSTIEVVMKHVYIRFVCHFLGSQQNIDNFDYLFLLLHDCLHTFGHGIHFHFSVYEYYCLFYVFLLLGLILLFER